MHAGEAECPLVLLWNCFSDPGVPMHLSVGDGGGAIEPDPAVR